MIKAQSLQSKNILGIFFLKKYWILNILGAPKNWHWEEEMN